MFNPVFTSGELTNVIVCHVKPGPSCFSTRNVNFIGQVGVYCLIEIIGPQNGRTLTLGIAKSLVGPVAYSQIPTRKSRL